MASVNKVILIGNVGRDPETKQVGQNNMAKFSIATKEKWKDGERTDWHNIICWSKQADFVTQYVSKGALVYVEGRLQTREYEKDGQKRYMTEVVANSVELLGGTKKPSVDNYADYPNRGEDVDTGVPF
jgi:single-strand DNA-binding protein